MPPNTLCMAQYAVDSIELLFYIVLLFDPSFFCPSLLPLLISFFLSFHDVLYNPVIHQLNKTGPETHLMREVGLNMNYKLNDADVSVS